MLMFCYCGFRVEIKDEDILFRHITVFKELTMKSSTDVEYCMIIMDSVCISCNEMDFVRLSI